MLAGISHCEAIFHARRAFHKSEGFISLKKAALWLLFSGAGSRARTGTVSPPVDFESTTSTNSIIPANWINCLFIIIRPGVKCKSVFMLSSNFLIFQMNWREDLWIFCGNSPKLIVEFCELCAIIVEHGIIPCF